MSTGVATTANASPRLHTAAHRHRVGDFMDCEKSSDCYLLNRVDYEYDYDYDYDHNDHRVIRYLWLLRRMEVMRGLAIAQCLVSGRNVGRTIFATLMMMVVVSVFVTGLGCVCIIHTKISIYNVMYIYNPYKKFSYIHDSKKFKAYFSLTITSNSLNLYSLGYKRHRD
ncbi:unnamed protein product [Camellia sinensis]